jgi:hypothetical protein
MGRLISVLVWKRIHFLFLAICIGKILTKVSESLT